MIDVKKLITGFLILAASAGLSAIVVTNINTQPATQISSSTPAIAISQTSTAQSNVFIPESPITDSVTPVIQTEGTIPTSSDPNNLTDNLANSFLNSVVSANPNGPQEDASGNPVFVQPDVNSIAMEVADATATQALQIPNWDTEVNNEPLHTIQNPTAEDMTDYENNVNYILGEYVVKPNLQQTINNPAASVDDLASVENNLSGALTDLTAINTPASLVPLQKSMIAMLVYESNEVQVAEGASGDPLKASLIIQGEQEKYDAAAQALESQIEQVSAANAPSNSIAMNAPLGFLQGMFGIQTAHAQFGGTVFVAGGYIATDDPGLFAQGVENLVNNIILQILKNVLIALIQQHVLSWIQGSGAPRFLTDWATTLTQAYTQTALNILSSQMSCAVGPEFMAQVRTTLSVYYQTPGTSGNVCADIFQESLGGNTLGQFYNNFSNGGWMAYGVTALPAGNYYQSAFFQAQATDLAAQQNQQATQAQSIASQGFTGDLVCDDGSQPNGTHLECIDKNNVPYHPNSNGTCDPGYFPVTVANNGKCADGTNPQTVTPGAATGFSLNSALNSPQQLITAANSIQGILNAMVTSLLNSLVSAAVNAGTNGLLGISPGSIQGGGTPPAPLPLTCNPPLQSASTTYPITISASGGKTDSQGNQPSYSWSSSDGFNTTGYVFSHAYNLAGTYTITLSDNTGDTPATCRATVQ